MKEFIIPMADDAPEDDIAELYGGNRRLIRCKDCKHGSDSHDGLNQWICIKPNTYDIYHDADYFCADGERRE